VQIETTVRSERIVMPSRKNAMALCA
jgi:hypothetical protein